MIFEIVDKIDTSYLNAQLLDNNNNLNQRLFIRLSRKII